MQKILCPKCEKENHKIQLVRKTKNIYVCARCNKEYKLTPS